NENTIVLFNNSGQQQWYELKGDLLDYKEEISDQINNKVYKLSDNKYIINIPEYTGIILV
ncbi:MAG: hypothetical protein ACLFUI_09005, partial [Halanaerobiales bacterium]